MKYNIIYADPPWNYNDKGCAGAAEQHYTTLSLEYLKRLRVIDIVADNAVLFLWCPYPMIPEMFPVMESWGFKYKTIGFNWIKHSKTRQKFAFGCGRWTRANSEPCFIGVRGKIKAIDHSISQLIVQPLTYHSEKPYVVRKKIVKLIGDLPRIELFARKKVDGWDCWGDEVESDIKLDFI